MLYYYCHCCFRVIIHFTIAFKFQESAVERHDINEPFSEVIFLLEDVHVCFSTHNYRVFLPDSHFISFNKPDVSLLLTISCED